MKKPQKKSFPPALNAVLPDWFTGADVREIQGPVYIPPAGKAGGYRKELAADIARKADGDPFRQRNIYSGVQAGADFIPLVGEDVGIHEVGEDIRSGNYIPAAFGAAGTLLGTVPIVGDVGGKMLKDAGKAFKRADDLPPPGGLFGAVQPGPSAELDEIIASGERQAAMPKVEPVQTGMPTKTPYDVMGKEDWVRFNRAHQTGEGVTEVNLPIGSLNAAHSVNPDFADAAARYTGGGADAKPFIIKKGGRYYVSDGTHRLAAAEKSGRRTADVRLVDLDVATGGGEAEAAPAPAPPRSPIAALDERVMDEAYTTRRSPRDVLKRLFGLD